MNENIRFFGWLLLYIGSILMFIGVMAVIDFVHIQIEIFGINLDRISERIAWIVCWLVAVVTGGLLISLTSPENQNKSVQS